MQLNAGHCNLQCLGQCEFGEEPVEAPGKFLELCEHVTLILCNTECLYFVVNALRPFHSQLYIVHEWMRALFLMFAAESISLSSKIFNVNEFTTCSELIDTNEFATLSLDISYFLFFFFVSHLLSNLNGFILFLFCALANRLTISRQKYQRQSLKKKSGVHGKHAFLQSILKWCLSDL